MEEDRDRIRVVEWEVIVEYHGQRGPHWGREYEQRKKE